jgi:hypothetical protein
MKELICKLYTFITKWYKPFSENLQLWLELMQTTTNSKYFWDDLSFFNTFNEDFFEWYRNDNFKEWLLERLKKYGN